MKVRETEILIVPGQSGPYPRHWQSRWQSKLSTARLVQQENWHAPQRERWTAAISGAVNEAAKPVVLVAHALGVAAAVQALPAFRRPVAGAFFVAPPELEGDRPEQIAKFGPYPRNRLPFPTLLVASRNDPDCAYEFSQGLASDWGALLIDAGQAGNIDAKAGYGPWPEGSMVFARFLSRL